MFKSLDKKSIRYHLPVLVCIILLVGLLLLPTGFEGAVIYKGTERSAARIVTTYDDRIINTGLIKSGEQSCTVEFLDGRFKGQKIRCI